jgi:hypothetical protein
MNITEEIIEAGARALHDADPGVFRAWADVVAAEAVGDRLAKRVADATRARARACLTAALAAADARGAVLAVVPGELPVRTSEFANGYNACRAAVLAGRVVV